MKQLTDTQKKWAWGIGAVLLLVHFLPNIISGVRHLISPPVVSAVRAKPSAAVPMPVPPPPPPAPRPDAPFTKLVGTWVGSSVTARGSCETRLVLKLKDDMPGMYSGYPTRVCGPLGTFLGGRPNVGRVREGVLNQMTQVSSIMSGSVDDGAIKLKVDQVVVDSPDDCEMTTMTLRPFGDNQIAAAWEESNACKGGQMLMGRVR